jgi:hypothetical protein
VSRREASGEGTQCELRPAVSSMGHWASLVFWWGRKLSEVCLGWFAYKCSDLLYFYFFQYTDWYIYTIYMKFFAKRFGYSTEYPWILVGPPLLCRLTNTKCRSYNYFSHQNKQNFSNAIMPNVLLPDQQHILVYRELSFNLSTLRIAPKKIVNN